MGKISDMERMGSGKILLLRREGKGGAWKDSLEQLLEDGLVSGEEAALWDEYRKEGEEKGEKARYAIRRAMPEAVRKCEERSREISSDPSFYLFGFPGDEIHGEIKGEEDKKQIKIMIEAVAREVGEAYVAIFREVRPKESHGYYQIRVFADEPLIEEGPGHPDAEMQKEILVGHFGDDLSGEPSAVEGSLRDYFVREVGEGVEVEKVFRKGGGRSYSPSIVIKYVKKEDEEGKSGGK